MGNRSEFWKNVVKRINFQTDEERRKIIKLTEIKVEGDQWRISDSFARIHRHVYHEIAEPINKYTEYVDRDVPRTFVLFDLPHDTTPMEPALHRVLNAIAEAEEGYCQGMNFIAAVFLVQGLSEEDSYITFLYLLKHKHLSQFYKESSIFLNEYLALFQDQLKIYLPELAERLEACGFSVYLYGIEWFTTIFSCSSKLDLCRAVLDMILVDVQDVMFRVGLALLKNVESQLMDLQFEDLLHQFKQIVKQADTYQVILDALSMAPHVTSPGGILAKTARKSLQPQGNWPFIRHRTLGPVFSEACKDGSFNKSHWEEWKATQNDPEAHQVIANEILHQAIWYGHLHIAAFAIHTCQADLNESDDFGIQPLHFAIVRNQPDIVRLLLVEGANLNSPGGNTIAMERALFMKTPLELVKHWSYSDLEAVDLVLSGKVCLQCNTKFPFFPLFTAKQCTVCGFQFCRQNCFERHRCKQKVDVGMSWVDGLKALCEDENAAVDEKSLRPCNSAWYCTEPECHSVFNLFRKRYECAVCHYSICSVHVESRTVQGQACCVCSTCSMDESSL
ncbi:unnamed protein product [Aphanomyces euteiches]|uniref:Rab-GAP TBC domain-containing protein n=1 Tax=Aphanomyces euteiches TaxID=100861 RepID=A0A6G0X0L2_9STRA|nr:hypothetical protein Ae201684_009577 [Aphanomyces euteiches]KAH9085349.1 hypothetical protein Ae201684P_005058 [Aphanomyces euteiches]KAH9154985.1 hypothetical protein AeRB84_002998 [Aphanomyces euteiches]